MIRVTRTVACLGTITLQLLGCGAAQAAGPSPEVIANCKKFAAIKAKQGKDIGLMFPSISGAILAATREERWRAAAEAKCLAAGEKGLKATKSQVDQKYKEVVVPAAGSASSTATAKSTRPTPAQPAATTPR